MAKLEPNEGGCWFCAEDEEKEGLMFSWEFDSFVHESCLLNEFHPPVGSCPEDCIVNPEAIIMVKEFGLWNKICERIK